MRAAFQHPKRFERRPSTTVATFLAGQNGLYAFSSHEAGGWVTVESTRALDHGQMLLHMFSDAMVDSEHIPEIYF